MELLDSIARLQDQIMEQRSKMESMEAELIESKEMNELLEFQILENKENMEHEFEVWIWDEFTLLFKTDFWFRTSIVHILFTNKLLDSYWHVNYVVC